MLPNLVGSVFSLYYLYVYETYTSKGAQYMELTRAYQFAILLLSFILVHASFGDLDSVPDTIGTIGAIVSIVFTSSPLLAIPAVIRNRSPESIPLPLSSLLFVASALWVMYGTIVANDRAIIIPNAFGTMVTALQLLVHLAFYMGFISSRKSSSENVKVASL